MSSEYVIAALGAAFGVWVALAIAASMLAAAKCAARSDLLDIGLRIGVIALLTVPVAHVIGQVFGSQVRQHAGWFWGCWAACFFLTPWLLGQAVKRTKRAP